MWWCKNKSLSSPEIESRSFKPYLVTLLSELTRLCVCDNSTERIAQAYCCELYVEYFCCVRMWTGWVRSEAQSNTVHRILNVFHQLQIIYHWMELTEGGKLQKNCSLNSQSFGRDSNRLPTKYKSVALTLEVISTINMKLSMIKDLRPELQKCTHQLYWHSNTKHLTAHEWAAYDVTWSRYCYSWPSSI
jgi:hypothetical protein